MIEKKRKIIIRREGRESEERKRRWWLERGGENKWMEIRFKLFFSCGGDVGQARDNSDVPSCGRENNINLTQRGGRGRRQN